ncbi:MAG: porin [Firmicutes bacterium]|nr:porin [Bacillota bacterium]
MRFGPALRVVGLILALVLAAIPAAAGLAAAIDGLVLLPRGHWVYNALEELSAAKLIEGYPVGSFERAGSDPDLLLARFEAAIVVSKARLGTDNGSGQPKGTGIRRSGLKKDLAAVLTRLEKELAVELALLGVESGEPGGESPSPVRRSLAEVRVPLPDADTRSKELDLDGIDPGLRKTGGAKGLKAQESGPEGWDSEGGAGYEARIGDVRIRASAGKARESTPSSGQEVSLKASAEYGGLELRAGIDSRDHFKRLSREVVARIPVLQELVALTAGVEVVDVSELEGQQGSGQASGEPGETQKTHRSLNAKAALDYKLSDATTLSASYQLGRSDGGVSSTAGLGLSHRLSENTTLMATYRLVNFGDETGTDGQVVSTASTKLSVKF